MITDTTPVETLSDLIDCCDCENCDDGGWDFVNDTHCDCLEGQKLERRGGTVHPSIDDLPPHYRALALIFTKLLK